MLTLLGCGSSGHTSAFLVGIARGFGFAMGMPLLAALVFLILKKAVAAPVIGRFITQILDVIEKQQQVLSDH